MSKIIVTGVDGSDTALQAAKKAASYAIAFEAELHVLSAYAVNMTETIQSIRSRSLPGEAASAYKSMVHDAAQEAERIAVSVAETLRNDFPNLTVLSRAVEGPPGAAISGESERVGADLIVVGNKRVQGPTRILGSVARAIAAETDCDLLIVNTH